MRATGLALVAALLVAAPLALAEEPTREQYVQRVDLICKKSERSNSRILKGVKRQIVKQGRLIPAGKRFIRASASFGRAVTQIAAVPQPAADEPRLRRWIGKLRQQQSLLRATGKALKSKKKGRANRLAVRLQRTNRGANNIVFSFEFDYCDREVQTL